MSMHTDKVSNNCLCNAAKLKPLLKTYICRQGKLEHLPSFNFPKYRLENSVTTPEADKITKLQSPVHKDQKNVHQSNQCANKKKQLNFSGFRASCNYDALV